MSVSPILERWLNGLVYELFFPGELAARKLAAVRKLALFAETARLNPPACAEASAGRPDLACLCDARTQAAVPEGQKLARLRELHAAAEKSALPAMLAGLEKLEVVRNPEEGSARWDPSKRTPRETTGNEVRNRRQTGMETP